MDSGSRRRQFIRRYDFPCHLPVIWNRLISGISEGFWTMRLRQQILFLGGTMGRGCRADGRVWVRAARRGAIRLGANVRINSRFGSNLVGLTNPTILHCMGEGRIAIGDNSGMSGAVLSSRASITIGRHVKLGGNARVYDHDYHAMDYLARRAYATDRDAVQSAPVVLEDDVFVGANAIILKGTHIGARSIVGAGAVVALREIPADSVVVGNPARIAEPHRG